MITVSLISCSILLLSIQSFAILDINIVGEVKSYEHKTGIYVVDTKQAIVILHNSELTPAIRRKLSRRIGRQTQVRVPHTAILSYNLKKSEKSKRKPSGSSKDQ